MNTQEPRKTGDKQNIWLIALIVVIILIIGWLVYRSLSTPSIPGTSFKKGDNIMVNLPSIKPGRFLVVVDKKVHILPPEAPTYSAKLTTGTHKIIISAPNYWPWSKNVMITKTSQITLRPFLLKKEPVTKTYQPTDAAYAHINSLFNSKNGRVTATSTSGNVVLNSSLGTLVARWVGEDPPADFFCATRTEGSSTVPQRVCGHARTVIELKNNSLLSAGFFESRNDVAVFGVPTGVYAIEIGGGKKLQNIEPIYRGNITALAIGSSTVYVKNATSTKTITAIPLP